MSVYILFGNPGSGSMAAEAALRLAGAPFDFVVPPRNPDGAEGFGGELARLNPRGQVPTLVLPTGEVVTECPAILAHIADAHPAAGLIPAAGTPARASHDRWMAFAHANLYEGFLRFFYSDRYTADPAPEAAAAVARAAAAYVARHFALLDEAVGAGPFLLGAQPTVADLMVWMLTCWADDPDVLAPCPAVRRLAAAVDALPGVAEVRAANGY